VTKLERLKEIEEISASTPELQNLKSLTIDLVERDIEDYYEITHRYKNLFEESPIGILYIHLEHKQIVGCNPAAQKHLGRKEEDLIGMELKNITEDLITPGIAKSKATEEQVGENFRWWFKVVKPNGQRFLVAWFTPRQTGATSTPRQTGATSTPR
jgi:PAS domain S-box-containing protein